MKTEKSIVLNPTTGYPKEIRYYEDGFLTARLGVILDADNKFIGLEELDPEAVMPLSWREKFLRLRKKPEKRIDITTVDFIGLINWIDTINVIKTINTIDSITTIGTIDEISRIKEAPYQKNPLLANADFETGDLAGWYILLGTPSVITDPTAPIGDHYLLMPENSKLYQPLNKPILTDNITKFSVYSRSVSGTPALNLYVIYSDGTVKLNALAHTTSWSEKTVAYDSAKWVVAIMLSEGAPEGIHVEQITLGVDDSVKQATRTNLLTKPEREDLIALYFTNTFAGAGDYQLLAAVASQYHKLYGFDYEISAAVSVRIRSGTTTKAIGVRTTAGVMAKTLTNPFICNVNEALNFRAEGAVTVTGSILYKTEA